MNVNKAKKIRVRFPNIVSGKMVVGECEKQVMKLPAIQDINNRIYSEMFSGSSNTQVGARGFIWKSKIRCYDKRVDR